MKSNLMTQMIQGLVCIAVSSTTFAAGPWLYSEGEGAAGVALVQETFDRAWEQGSSAFAEPNVIQNNAWLWGQYGVSDQLTLSAQIGYTEASLQGSTYEYSGLADTKLGLQFQVLNEWEDSPLTANVTSALILKGSYDRAAMGRPHAPGDRANGLEVGGQVGRFIVSNFSAWTDFGYRKMFDDVPDEVFFGLGGTAYLNAFYFDAAWKTKRSRDGLDIGLGDFTPDRFHELKEERDWTEWTLGYAVTEHINVALTYAKTLTGSNTGDSSIYSLAFGYGFNSF